MVQIRHSTSAETHMWGKQRAAMLAIYTGRGVAPDMNLRECISCMPPQSLNKAEPILALKPRGDVTRSPKQGYQWPHKWTCVQQNFFKKNQKTIYFCLVLGHLNANQMSKFNFCNCSYQMVIQSIEHSALNRCT